MLQNVYFLSLLGFKLQSRQGGVELWVSRVMLHMFSICAQVFIPALPFIPAFFMLVFLAGINCLWLTAEVHPLLLL